MDHIEFYPGYFGVEETWPSCSDSKECAPGDVAACVANTKGMREAALIILNGSTAAPSWSQLSPAGTLPAARYGHSAVIDSASHRMIVFGGNSDANALNDTWILTNADRNSGEPAWMNVQTASAPPANYSARMYDPTSNRMIVYGGAAGTDVWVLTNANGLGTDAPSWVELSPAGSPPPYLTNWEKHVRRAR